MYFDNYSDNISLKFIRSCHRYIRPCGVNRLAHSAAKHVRNQINGDGRSQEFDIRRNITAVSLCAGAAVAGIGKNSDYAAILSRLR